VRKTQADSTGTVSIVPEVGSAIEPNRIEKNEARQLCSLTIFSVDLDNGRLGNILTQLSPFLGVEKRWRDGEANDLALLFLLTGRVGERWSLVNGVGMLDGRSSVGGRDADAEREWVGCFPPLVPHLLPQRDGAPVALATVRDLEPYLPTGPTHDCPKPTLTLTPGEAEGDAWLLRSGRNASLALRLSPDAWLSRADVIAIAESLALPRWEEPEVAGSLWQGEDSSARTRRPSWVPEAGPDVDAGLQSQHHGAGSWWWNYRAFIEPQLSSLRPILRPSCCGPEVPAPATLADVMVHLRDFRHETGFNGNSSPSATVSRLLYRPTLRATYLVSLLRSLSPTTLTIVTERSFAEREEFAPILAAFPFATVSTLPTDEHGLVDRYQELSTSRSPSVADFCRLSHHAGTLVLGAGSTFSYWASIVGEARRIIVPRVRGVRANNEPESDSGKRYRDPWPAAGDDRFVFIDVPHSAIDTRDAAGEELPWLDRTYNNGTQRSEPLARPHATEL